MVVCYFRAKKEGVPREEGGFELKNVWKAFTESFLALLMPPLIVVSIMSGVVSPTEVALITVVYALIVGKLVYHELDWKSFKMALINTVKTSSKIFLIIGIASVFGKLLTVGGFDKLVARTLLSLTDSPTVILLIILGILFIMGMFMETISIIVLFIPMIYPVAMQVGIDLIHLSVLAVIVLGIGLVTPPEGMCLFICCDFLKVRIWDAMIALIPFIIVMLLVVGLLILFPQLVLWPTSFVG
jgi:tripartite ATP-independent transporter DctM subunit